MSAEHARLAFQRAICTYRPPRDEAERLTALFETALGADDAAAWIDLADEIDLMEQRGRGFCFALSLRRAASVAAPAAVAELELGFIRTVSP